MKIALIGCGYWGGIVAKSLKRDGRLFSVYDARATAADALANTHQVAVKNIPALAGCDECTGIYIAVPFGYRGNIVEDALCTGKPVLVEKPLHRDFAEVRSLINHARAHNTTIHAGHLLHYNPEIIRLKQFVKTLEKGQLERVTIKRFGTGRAYTHQDVIMDFTIHDVSIAQAVLGPLCPELVSLEVKGEGTPPHHVEIECLLKSGVRLTIADNNNTDSAERSTVLELKDASFRLDEKTGESVMIYPDGTRKIDPLPAYISPNPNLFGDPIGLMVDTLFAHPKEPAAYRGETNLTEDAYKFTDKVRSCLESAL